MEHFLQLVHGFFKALVPMGHGIGHFIDFTDQRQIGAPFGNPVHQAVPFQGFPAQHHQGWSAEGRHIVHAAFVADAQHGIFHPIGFCPAAQKDFPCRQGNLQHLLLAHRRQSTCHNCLLYR